MSLQWGLAPERPYLAAWGARAIWTGANLDGTPCPIDLLPDRQDAVGDKASRHTLEMWVRRALPEMRRKLHDERILESDNLETVITDDLGLERMTLRANPRRSHGYLYLVATLQRSEEVSPMRKGAIEHPTSCVLHKLKRGTSDGWCWQWATHLRVYPPGRPAFLLDGHYFCGQESEALQAAAADFLVRTEAHRKGTQPCVLAKHHCAVWKEGGLVQAPILHDGSLGAVQPVDELTDLWKDAIAFLDAGGEP